MPFITSKLVHSNAINLRSSALCIIVFFRPCLSIFFIKKRVFNIKNQPSPNKETTLLLGDLFFVCVIYVSLKINNLDAQTQHVRLAILKIIICHFENLLTYHGIHGSLVKHRLFSPTIKHRLKTRSSGSKSRSLDGFPLPLAIKSSNNFSGTPSLCSDKDRRCHRKVVCTKARGTKRHLGDVIHLRCSGSGMKSLAFDSSSELLVSMQHDKQ